MHDMALAMTRMCVLCLLPLLVIPAHAQKKEKACEVVARVNGHPITEAAYLAALRDYRKDFSWQMEMQSKSQREIDAELARRKPTLLDDLIDEFLLAQRGNELGFDGDGELKRIENAIDPDYRDNFPLLDETVREQGIYLELHAARRRQALGQRAIQIEILEPIFHSITDSERRDYYDNHKEKFMLPSTVTLSELFLPFDGHSEAEVKERAHQLLSGLRAGADFFKAVAENSSESRPSYRKRGSLGSFRLDEIKESLAVDLARVNPGEFTQPMQLGAGYQIIRLDERTPETPRSYEDPMTQEEVFRPITMSRAERIRKSYLARLRENARIEVCSVK